VHAVPHAIPAGTDVTEPLPLPARATVSANVCSVNVAVTVVAAVIVIVHGPVPLHPPPDHPVNVEPVAGTAVSVVTSPALYVCWHVVPHAIAAGLDVTVPVPLPPRDTNSVTSFSAKFAVIAASAVTVTVHASIPEHAPPHPAKLDSAAGVAVSVTTVP
jgi:hypothetical protein